MNKNLSHSVFLNYITILCFGVTLFPFFILATFLPEQVGVNVTLAAQLTFLSLAISTISFLVCYKLATVLSYVVFTILRIALLVAFLVTSILVLLHTNILFAFILTFAFLTGLFNSKFSLKYTTVVFFAVANLVQIILLMYFEIEYSATPNIWFFFLYCVLFLIFSNQNNINYLMERRSHRLEQLPAKIRVYNLTLVIIVLAVMAFCFLLKDQIANLFGGVFYAFGSFIVYLLNLVPNSENKVVQDPLIKQEDGEMLKAEHNPYGDIIDNVVVFLLVVLAIYVLIKNYRRIINFFVEKFGDTIEKIKNLFAKWFSNSKIEKYLSNKYEEAYQDQIISIERGGLLQGLREQKKYTFKSWKKEYNIFLNTKDPKEQMQKAHSLVVSWLKLNNVELTASQTAIEVFEKSKTLLNEPNWQTCTNEYNQVFYNDQEPNLANFKKLCEIIKNRKIKK